MCYKAYRKPSSSEEEDTHKCECEEKGKCDGACQREKGTDKSVPLKILFFCGA